MVFSHIFLQLMTFRAQPFYFKRSSHAADVVRGRILFLSSMCNVFDDELAACSFTLSYLRFDQSYHS